MSKETNHPEWRKENTLTAPSDRKANFRPEQGAPQLTEEQVQEAMTELNNTAFIERFPAVESRFADPSVDMQNVGLISFVPAQGAKPNERGVFGFAKLRGNYPNPEEASERAEYLIRNVDSYHQIYHTFVGRPFPITASSDYSKEVNRVDLKKETTEAIRADVKAKREKEQREIEEIQAREKELLADVKKEKEETIDRYTTLCTKKAQLTWTYIETKKRLEQMVGLIAKARHEIDVLNNRQPELKDQYLDKYMDARRQAGLSDEIASDDQTFMRYLVEDVSIPEIDAEYETLYGGNGLNVDDIPDDVPELLDNEEDDEVKEEE